MHANFIKNKGFSFKLDSEPVITANSDAWSSLLRKGAAISWIYHLKLPRS
jgi:hypothetical protein